MSWKFPRHPIQSGRVPNVDDTNANFREFTEEIGGKLNEQNWHKDAVDSHSQIARKAAFVWHYARPDPQGSQQLLTQPAMQH